ncbi:MAG: YeeE/YedE family protein [Proteobacteria bacterium]|nr:YeeE/YedE family protein [Pseudomonadota bacterium]MBU1639066.1 YeeE/YedE family protein [Pseudomonadota bacterium]
MEIFLAILLGTLFGFVLHRVGASNPENIINMLRFKDLHLMKAILFAIGLASSLLFIGMTVGFINPSHLDIKASYWGVLVGGLLLGTGWAIAGYCPGTGLVALGDGRKDALPFLVGGLVGAFLYMVLYGRLKGTFLLAEIAGGKSTLAMTPSNHPALITGLPGLAVALVVGVLFIAIAFALPSKK